MRAWQRETVLFLEGNDAARSQMAAARLDHLAGRHYSIRTAGPFPAFAVRPEAVAVMDEVGVPILARPGTHTREYVGERFDRVYAICDQGSEPCPVFPGGAVCWPVPDPAKAPGDDAPLERYRRARGVLRELVREHFGV